MWFHIRHRIHNSFAESSVVPFGQTLGKYPRVCCSQGPQQCRDEGKHFHCRLLVRYLHASKYTRPGHSHWRNHVHAQFKCFTGRCDQTYSHANADRKSKICIQHGDVHANINANINANTVAPNSKNEPPTAKKTDMRTNFNSTTRTSFFQIFFVLKFFSS